MSAPPRPLSRTFGQWLRKVRTDAGVTTRDVSHLCGVSHKIAKQWEADESIPNSYQLKGLVKMLPRLGPHMHLLAKQLKEQEEKMKTTEVKTNVGEKLKEALAPKPAPPPEPPKPALVVVPPPTQEHVVGRTKSRLDIEVRRAYARQVVTPEDTVISLRAKVHAKYGVGLDGPFLTKLVHDTKGRKRRSDWKGTLPSEVPMKKRWPTDPTKVAEIEKQAAAIVGTTSRERMDDEIREATRANDALNDADFGSEPEKMERAGDLRREDDIRAAAELLKGAIPGLAEFTLKVADDGGIEVDWSVRQVIVNKGRITYR